MPFEITTSTADERFYAADEAFWEAVADRALPVDLDPLPPAQVEGFVVDLLARSGRSRAAGAASAEGAKGMRGAARVEPVVPVLVFDIPDDSVWAGVHSRDGRVHLHPRLATPAAVAHEVAHWLVGGIVGHGPEFLAAYADLVEVACGAVARRLLVEVFAEHGLVTPAG